jgi:hypothetical protein
MPSLFDVGEILDVHLRYVDAFDPEWGIHLRTTQEVRFFAFAGGFTDARFRALTPPVEIELDELCSTGSDSCYNSGVRLSANVSSGDDRISVAPKTSDSLTIQDQVVRVLNYTASKFGVATGNCTNTVPPGERLHLQILPFDVDL